MFSMLAGKAIYHFACFGAHKFKLLAVLNKNCQTLVHGLAVPHADDRSYVTGSIRGWIAFGMYIGWMLTRRAHFTVSLNHWLFFSSI